jgi:hypothetical protein
MPLMQLGKVGHDGRTAQLSDWSPREVSVGERYFVGLKLDDDEACVSSRVVEKPLTKKNARKPCDRVSVSGSRPQSAPLSMVWLVTLLVVASVAVRFEELRSNSVARAATALRAAGFTDMTVAGADTVSLCLTEDSLHRRFSGTDRHGVSVQGAICGNGEARIVRQ